MIKQFVYCTFRFEGFHCWPDAPDQVAHLRSSHRHEFHVRAHVEVFHGDREVEFQLLKIELQELVAKWPKNLGARSCEMMAEHLISYIRSQYCKAQERRIEVEVNEDGENGSVLSYHPEQ